MHAFDTYAIPACLNLEVGDGGGGGGGGEVSRDFD